MQSQNSLLRAFLSRYQAEVIDHFLPVTHAHLYDYGHYTVDSCNSCNSLAHNKVFENIDEKMKYIHDSLKGKNWAILGLPEWTEKEIGELGWLLRQDVRLAIKEKQRLQLRLTWRNRDNLAHVQLAAIYIDLRGDGRSSVRPHAERLGIRSSELQQLPPGERIRRTLKKVRIEASLEELGL